MGWVGSGCKRAEHHHPDTRTGDVPHATSQNSCAEAQVWLFRGVKDPPIDPSPRLVWTLFVLD